MRPSDDDRVEMDLRRPEPPLDDRTVEALLAGRDVPQHEDIAGALTLLRAAGEGPAPAATARLAELLAAGFDPAVVSVTAAARQRRSWPLRVTLTLAAAAMTTLGAASANALPAPAQSAIAGVMGAITPFELPRPQGEGAFDHAVPAVGNPPAADVEAEDHNDLPAGVRPPAPARKTAPAARSSAARNDDDPGRSRRRGGSDDRDDDRSGPGGGSRSEGDGDDGSDSDEAAEEPTDRDADRSGGDGQQGSDDVATDGQPDTEPNADHDENDLEDDEDDVDDVDEVDHDDDVDGDSDD